MITIRNLRTTRVIHSHVELPTNEHRCVFRIDKNQLSFYYSIVIEKDHWEQPFKEKEKDAQMSRENLFCFSINFGEDFFTFFTSHRLPLQRSTSQRHCSRKRL